MGQISKIKYAFVGKICLGIFWDRLEELKLSGNAILGRISEVRVREL